MSRETGYGPKMDALLYDGSSALVFSSMTPDDWAQLALVCVDQAGLDVAAQQSICNILRVHGLDEGVEAYKKQTTVCTTCGALRFLDGRCSMGCGVDV